MAAVLILVLGFVVGWLAHKGERKSHIDSMLITEYYKGYHRGYSDRSLGRPDASAGHVVNGDYEI